MLGEFDDLEPEADSDAISIGGQITVEDSNNNVYIMRRHGYKGKDVQPWEVTTNPKLLLWKSDKKFGWMHDSENAAIKVI